MGGFLSKSGNYVQRFSTAASALLLLLSSGAKAQFVLAHPVDGSITPAPALIGAEAFLALWLLARAFPRIAWKIALFAFCVFGCFTFYRGITSAESCGCFGAAKVKPWHTFALDCGMIGLLWWGRPRNAEYQVLNAETEDVRTRRQYSRTVEVMLFSTAMMLGLAVGLGLWYFQPRAMAAGIGELQTSGKWVILEPEKWVGKRFPLAAEIVIGEQLMHGRWIVVIYHADCETCRKAIPVYLGMETGRVCFVEMPPYAAPADDPLQSHADEDTRTTMRSEDAGKDARVTRGKLSEKHEWFATTPVVVELSDGVVLRAASGEAATNLEWMK